MVVKLTLEYDGTNYFGFQKQNKLISIEECLLKAINKIDKNVDKVHGSGRTDRGVHAKGQVAHFETTLDIFESNWKISINAYLPKDIRITKAEIKPDSFHARFNAIGKRYSYLIKQDNYSVFDRNYYLYQPNLNVDLMINASKLLLGTHDFKGFCSSKINELKSTIRTITKINFINKNDVLEIEFIGDGFLRYQIRKMVGSLIDIGLNKMTIEQFDNIIQSCDPSLSNKTAQPQGLYLMEVIYED